MKHRKVLILIMFSLSILSFVICTFGVISKKLFLIQGYEDLYTSSESFIVLALMFRSLIHFELIFAYGVMQETNFILLHVEIYYLKIHIAQFKK